MQIINFFGVPIGGTKKFSKYWTPLVVTNNVTKSNLQVTGSTPRVIRTM
jgi:hypothetical protein